MQFWPKPPTFPFTFQKNLEEAGRPISSNSSEDGLLSEKDIRSLRSSRSPFSRTWICICLSHLILFAIYLATIISLRTEVHRLRKHGPQLVNTPANEALEWELRKFDTNDNQNGPFSGKPREEIDRNWHKLLNSENIIIESEYMKQWGRENYGVASPDGNGFLGTLNVYHELHCIKRLYQYTYPDTYAKGRTSGDIERDRAHKDHCLDFLRQSAMCHGDIGVITFQWSPDSLVPVANSTFHQCVNWEKLDTWTKARTVDMMKPGWLVHPTKGLAYPEGNEW
ncbi:tat pathway signal sequence [Xylaria bambusicola]|uniref:tat pathway signal sequence n=1 Tax=Xylaria bambusicola TaxID=326684 RepID=UPI002008C2FA|nr:tat pathway signal sequence [Xylaria bambusicola]KAI0505386.1 tat pathway signal sequence [Xylaria bambusicola]